MTMGFKQPVPKHLRDAIEAAPEMKMGEGPEMKYGDGPEMGHDSPAEAHCMGPRMDARVVKKVYKKKQ